MTAIIAPGATIGIIGAGQLGRMSAVAAAELGYRTHIFAPEEDGPAFQVATRHTRADYTDEQALKAFAEGCDVITFEFENIPKACVQWLAARAPVRPGWKSLATSQDRIVEKTFLNALGVATAPWRAIHGGEDLRVALKDTPERAILKTARLGYDGKGQIRVDKDTECSSAWAALETGSAVLEGFVDFKMELSVIVARGPDGAMAAYDPVENRHVGGILDTTIAPATIPAAVAAEATAIAEKIAQALDLVGLLAVEFFLTPDDRLSVNEIAPRPHNSGHWTQDGAVTSQFEQFIRAVCGLPLGSPARHSDTVMKNLIGDDADDWLNILSDPDNRLHLYGKRKARPGRKMGHVNRLYCKGNKPEL